MATAGTQVTGTASEVAYSTTPAAGFFGWSPQDTTTRYVHNVTGGNYKGAYANSTAYAVGDVVLSGGVTYRAVAAVANTNTTAPVVGAVWVDASNHRGAAEVPGSHVQFYR